MATGEKRIDQLTKTLTELADDDVLPVQDVSDNETAQIKVSDLRDALASSLQDAYNAGASPAVETTFERGALTVTTPGLAPAIVVRAEVESVLFEGAALTAAGLTSAAELEVKPAASEDGLALRLRGGDAGEGQTGGSVQLDAGSGGLGGGQVQIGGGAAGSIQSGSGDTPWTHQGSLTVLHDVTAANLPKNNFDAFGPPTVDDDETEGYSLGSLWIWRLSYATDAGRIWQCVQANEGDAVWRVIDDQPRAPRQTSDESITVDRADHGDVIYTTSANPVTVTADPAQEGNTVAFIQGGAGQITVQTSGGLLLYAPTFVPKSAETYSLITVYWVSASTVLVTGDLEAA